MTQKTYLSSKYIDIYFDEISKIGYALWKDFCSEEEYRNALLEEEKMVRNESLTLMIVDIRNFKGTSVANIKWTNDEVQPRLYNSTLKKMAFIVGNSVFGNFTLTTIKKKFETDGVLLTNAFTENESAVKWLLE